MKLGPWEIVAIVGVVLVLFGPSRLPALGKGFADFIRSFKKGIREVEQDAAPLKEIMR